MGAVFLSTCNVDLSVGVWCVVAVAADRERVMSESGGRPRKCESNPTSDSEAQYASAGYLHALLAE